MRAQIGEARDLVAESDDHELLIEQRHRQGPIFEVRRPRHGLPATPEGSMETRLARWVEVHVHGSADRLVHAAIVAADPDANRGPISSSVVLGRKRG
jgi:hypothetical protein